jgi:hypothetical protein
MFGSAVSTAVVVVVSEVPRFSGSDGELAAPAGAVAGFYDVHPRATEFVVSVVVAASLSVASCAVGRLPMLGASAGLRDECWASWRAANTHG